MCLCVREFCRKFKKEKRLHNARKKNITKNLVLVMDDYEEEHNGFLCLMLLWVSKLVKHTHLSQTAQVRFSTN